MFLGSGFTPCCQSTDRRNVKRMHWVRDHFMWYFRDLYAHIAHIVVRQHVCVFDCQRYSFVWIWSVNPLQAMTDFLLKHRQAKENRVARHRQSSARLRPVDRHNAHSAFTSQLIKLQDVRQMKNISKREELQNYRKKEPNKMEGLMVNWAAPSKWALLRKAMTYKSIYETIKVAICLAIDLRAHTIERRYELVWKSIYALDDYELLRGAGFSRPLSDYDLGKPCHR